MRILLAGLLGAIASTFTEVMKYVFAGAAITAFLAWRARRTA
ncbi:MAG TPA: hypothetical protein VII63_01345 [Caulobacteraceae bacterium]